MGRRRISRHFERNILRRLQFESLEPRRVMAGNVTAEVIDGDLIITGDDAANTISVRGKDGTIVVESDGGFRVFATSNSSSADEPLSNPTQVNGEFQNAQFEGVTGNIVINAGGGNDRVVIRNVIYNGFSVSPSSFSALGDLIIDGGAGNDQIEVGEEIQPTVFTIPPGGQAVPVDPDPPPELSIAGNLQIDTAEDGGSVIVRPGMVGGAIEISAASGEGTNGNSISLFGVTASSCTVVGSDVSDRIFVSTLSVSRLTIAAGLGDDIVDVDSLDAAGDSSIDLGAGTDHATVDGAVRGNLAVRGETGSDTLILGGENRSQFIQQHGQPDNPLRLMQLGAGGPLLVHGNLTVETGGGDYLNLQHTTVANTLSIRSGEVTTPEFIRIRHVAARIARLDTGGGNDIVNIAFMGAAALHFDLGQGDDFLSMAIVGFMPPTLPLPPLSMPIIYNVAISGRDGRDGIVLDGCDLQSAVGIDAGEGDNYVAVNRSIFYGAGIVGGAGSDVVRTEFSLFHRLRITAGGGSDDVRTAVCAVDEVFYDMGAGDDTIELFGSVVRVVANADGGAGFDTLKRLNSRIKQFNATNFEAGNDAGLLFA